MNIDAPLLKEWLLDDEEVALLDAREEGDFTEKGHILLASNVPLSRLEFLIADLVPRRDTRVIWVDAGEGVAARAAERACELGYSNVHVLAGGTPAWLEAGNPLYEGIYVPSKAFAEVVEHDAATPYITPEQLADWQQQGKNIAIFDTRTYDEYHANTIPGAVSMPGAEIVYRVPGVVTDPHTVVVVNCGGRTRSIIGAQSLINAGFDNKVVSLKDGTMGWHLAGLKVANGSTDMAPPPSDASLPKIRQEASRVAHSFGVETIDVSALHALRADATNTTYVLDVRSPGEYARGHFPGSRSAPGGQLVQETDVHVAVWGAHVVLVDDDGVRANMTGSWLAQMGWRVSVLTVGAGELTQSGAVGPVSMVAPSVPVEAYVEVGELAQMLASGDVTVIDLARSRQHRKGHIKGARFTVRARLEEQLRNLAGSVVLTSEDGHLAELGWCDVAATGSHGVDLRVLRGGTSAWVADGHALVSGLADPLGPVDDCWYTPRDRDPDKREQAMNDYLTWEANLVHDMAKDDLHRFRGVRSLGRD
ncbi:MAG: hypothetical protein K0U93_26750 [Gammaproteobacteria bacterium]|nr:hypothetical protein [Gammaproteobacteria bacterium]